MIELVQHKQYKIHKFELHTLEIGTFLTLTFY